MVVPKPMLTEFGIHYRLESCEGHTVYLIKMFVTVGFEEGTDTLILPFDAKMPVVKAFRDAVQSVVEQKTTTSTVASLSPSASLQTG